MIEVEHLSKTYGSTAAIADVSFSVETGEILGFLGPNGAGKTTTMRILSGYLPASSGTARIAGLDIHENSMAVRQRIGYLPENPPLYPEMTVEGFLFFVARIKQVSAGDRAHRVTSAIDCCGLTEKRKILIRKLSKGFKQRVGIAQAIVHDPPVIILDEPTVGLDPRQIIEVRNLIKSLGGQHTIILSTHILPEVSMTCNRVTIINRGQIVAAGSPQNLTGELVAGSGYELEVEGEEELVNSLLLPAVENLPGVRSIELIANQESLAGRYRLRALCEPDLESGREIAAAIIASGFGLCEMRRNRATLEDVFLKLTTAEKKQGDVLIETEPEVGENLEVAETPAIISDSESVSETIVETENAIELSESASEPVAERVESLYDSQPEPEPVAEIEDAIIEPSQSELESVVEIEDSIIEHPQPEPESVVEIEDSIIEHPQSESEPVAEIEESVIEPSQLESESVVEIEDSIIEPSQPEPESVVEIEDSIIQHSQPESESVVEIEDSIIQHSQPESESVVEIEDSIIEPSQPESEPVVERLKSIGDIEPELQPVADFLEIVEKQELIDYSQPKSVVETEHSLESSQPETVVRNRQTKKRQQPISDASPEEPPVTKKRQIERKQQDRDDSERPPANDAE
jgi:ribosome-dependent ATPase